MQKRYKEKIARSGEAEVAYTAGSWINRSIRRLVGGGGAAAEADGDEEPEGGRTQTEQDPADCGAIYGRDYIAP